MKTTIYATDAILYSTSDSLHAMLAIVTWLGWKEPKFVVGIEEVARMTKGRFNPSADFVMVMHNNAQVRNPIELAKWIDQQGLVPL